MADPTLDDEDEKPLDPAVARIASRVRGLMLVAFLTLGVGIFAVFAAILYRIVTYDSTSGMETVATPPALSLSDLGLPADAQLVSTALDGNRLALTYADGSGTLTVIVDTRTGAVTGRVRVDGR